MRIIAGRHRGTHLATPADVRIRPTTDRVRETLFNLLEHRFGDPVREARILDLFAGTGALGFEALSRGAAYCIFVEEAASARGLIRSNGEKLGRMGEMKIFRRDATRLGALAALAPFSLVFTDPPYGQGLGEKALSAALAGGWLAPGAIAVLEEAAGTVITPITGFKLLHTHPIGDTCLHFLTTP